MILQRVTRNKRDTVIVSTTASVVVCNNLYWLLSFIYHKPTRDLSTAIGQIDYVTPKSY